MCLVVLPIDEGVHRTDNGRRRRQRQDEAGHRQEMTTLPVDRAEQRIAARARSTLRAFPWASPASRAARARGAHAADPHQTARPDRCRPRRRAVNNNAPADVPSGSPRRTRSPTDTLNSASGPYVVRTPSSWLIVTHRRPATTPANCTVPSADATTVVPAGGGVLDAAVARAVRRGRRAKRIADGRIDRRRVDDRAPARRLSARPRRARRTRAGWR